MGLDDEVSYIRRDQVLNGYSDEVIGFKLAYGFLDNGLTEDGSESWVLDFLSRSSEDYSDSSGVEEGRVKLEDPFLILSDFRSCDFVDGALSTHYQIDSGDDKGLGDYYSNNQFGIVFNTFNAIYNDDVWRCTNSDRSTTNKYSLNVSMDDFRELYDSLERVVFPSDDLVRDELGFSVSDVSLEDHVEAFPYAHNEHVASQIDIAKDRVISERKDYVRD